MSSDLVNVTSLQRLSIIRDLACPVPSRSDGRSQAVLTTGCWAQTVTGVHNNCPVTGWTEAEKEGKGYSLCDLYLPTQASLPLTYGKSNKFQVSTEKIREEKAKET